ncbi:MAG TPA: hypothetical protein PKE30_15215, partial [Niabella sp.]|nr:hypothetical protein [Niabella sp.]
MKNNPNTKYMLIGLVMLIWGLIIYKMVSGLSDDGMPVSQEVYKPLPRKNTDTAYALLADNYADPFFNEIEIEEDTISGNGSEMDVVSTVPPIYELPVTQTLVEPPPSIKYNGYIYNPLTKQRTALI